MSPNFVKNDVLAQDKRLFISQRKSKAKLYKSNAIEEQEEQSVATPAKTENTVEAPIINTAQDQQY